MSVLALFAHIPTGKLTDASGGQVSLRDFVLGDTPRFTLRTLDTNDAGALIERDLRIRALNATIGKTIKPPEAGEFTLKIEGVEVGPFTPVTTIEEFVAALAPQQPVAQSQLGAAACWLVSFTNQSELVIIDFANTLAPDSLVRVRTFIESGRRWYEIRAIQAPLAWNVAGHDRVLAPPPSVRRVITGAFATADAEEVNELQDIFFPPAFRGTFFFDWNLKSTRLMGMQDGPEDIEKALNAMFATGSGRFRVTNAEADHEYVEFTGDLGGAPQPKIEVRVNSFRPGVLTFDIPLDRANLNTALRDPRNASGEPVDYVEVPLEIEAEILDDTQDMADLTVPGRIVTLCQQTVKIVREQKWNELTVVKAVNFLRPGNPRDYIEVTQDQILFGTPGFKQALGDAERKDFTLVHPLNTRDGVVIAMENNAGRRVLGFPGEFTYSFPDDGAIALSFTVAPAVNGVVVIFLALGPGAFFQAHTHTMAQIVGLLEALAAIRADIAEIKDLLPHESPARLDDTATKTEIEIPPLAEIFPGKIPADLDPPKYSKLPRPAGLLPAIHDATVEPLALPLGAASDFSGQVFVNDTGETLIIPGGLGRRSAKLKPGGYLGSDGRVWYLLTRAGTTNSFYPTDFERELFMLHINDRMLRAGGVFSVHFTVDLALLKANTRAQMLAVIELGVAPGQTTPAPVDQNLWDVQWNPVPILSQRIILSGLKIAHKFGAAVRRNTLNVMSADRLVYGRWEGAPEVVPLQNFAIRARLIQFDTENSVAGATGFVSYALSDAAASTE